MMDDFGLKFHTLKGAERSEDLKVSKTILLFLNHHNFLNTEPIYTKQSFMESLLNYLALSSKTVEQIY